jgi:hypothetical protein
VLAPTWVNTTSYYKYSRAPDDGRKHCPKHVEPTWNNKLIYIVHLVALFSYQNYTTEISGLKPVMFFADVVCCGCSSSL